MPGRQAPSWHALAFSLGKLGRVDLLNDNVQRVSDDDDDDDDEPRDCWAAYFQTAFVLEPGWLELFNKLCSLEGTASFLLDRKQRHLIG